MKSSAAGRSAGVGVSVSVGGCGAGAGGAAGAGVLGGGGGGVAAGRRHVERARFAVQGDFVLTDRDLDVDTRLGNVDGSRRRGVGDRGAHLFEHRAQGHEGRRPAHERRQHPALRELVGLGVHVLVVEDQRHFARRRNSEVRPLGRARLRACGSKRGRGERCDGKHGESQSFQVLPSGVVVASSHRPWRRSLCQTGRPVRSFHLATKWLERQRRPRSKRGRPNLAPRAAAGESV